jgi:inositol polyphosphate-4-phosphatase
MYFRTNIQVTILLETEYFCHLPKELQEGKLIRVSPVIFTQGINENATLAER